MTARLESERPDLLALGGDDLAALANRGLVKRAQRELESPELAVGWQVGENGEVVAAWSDGATCRLPAGKTLRDATCSCGALELCRHVLRTVLAWQARAAAQVGTGGSVASALPAPWDPGAIDDATLAIQVPAKTRSRAAAAWSQGVLAELLRTAKPSARLYVQGHTVRFPVPGDLRYCLCSCAESPPCEHALLAVWAFRRLPAGQTSGLVAEGAASTPPPAAPLDAAAHCVRELALHGLASLPATWRAKVQRVAAENRAAGASWPAQILEELAEDYERYHARDATFAPAELVARAGELLLRRDAIVAGKAPVPHAFLSGLASDRDSRLGSALFVGLGAHLAESRQATRLTVFLQDAQSGHAVTFGRELAEDPEELGGRRSFAALGQLKAVKDASWQALGAGQLVLQGGKRLASGRLSIGRARAAVNPQAYQWERLKAPLLVEDFAELAARLRLLAPASFRPRQVAADFHACPLVAVEEAGYDPARHAIVARVRDGAGQTALLEHPWSARGEQGAEELLAALRGPDQPRFVAGLVRSRGAHLVLEPTAVVFEGAAGRRAVLPYLGRPGAAPPPRVGRLARPTTENRWPAATELAAALLLQGSHRLRQQNWPGWPRAEDELAGAGYRRLAALVRRLREPAPEVAVDTLLKLLRLDQDLGPEG